MAARRFGTQLCRPDDLGTVEGLGVLAVGQAT